MKESTIIMNFNKLFARQAILNQSVEAAVGMTGILVDLFIKKGLITREEITEAFVGPQAPTEVKDETIREGLGESASVDSQPAPTTGADVGAGESAVAGESAGTGDAPGVDNQAIPGSESQNQAGTL